MGLWTREHDDRFLELKTLLSSNPILTIFDPQSKTIVYTDASRDGLGGILTQVMG